MRVRIDLKILIFLVILHFTNQIRIYLILMLFCIIHEIGHILAGLILKMKPEKLEIMPFGLSISFYKEINNKKTNIKEICVAIAGPIVSLILVILCRYIDLKFITVQEAVYSNILILLFNLIPIYPLDGGRIIKGILHISLGEDISESIMEKVSKITLVILTLISSIAVYYYKNIAIFLTCIFLWIICSQEKNVKTLAIFEGK